MELEWLSRPIRYCFSCGNTFGSEFRTCEECFSDRTVNLDKVMIWIRLLQNGHVVPCREDPNPLRVRYRNLVEHCCIGCGIVVDSPTGTWQCQICNTDTMFELRTAR